MLTAHPNHGILNWFKKDLLGRREMVAIDTLFVFICFGIAQSSIWLEEDITYVKFKSLIFNLVLGFMLYVATISLTSK